MTIDAKIKVLRAELQKLKDEEELKKNELHRLFLEKASNICPIAIGTRIEYEPGKFGQVDRIEYVVELLHELDPNADVHWAVTGRKISKTGEFGVKDFKSVGPVTHFVNGVTFKHKGIGGIFGIDDSND